MKLCFLANSASIHTQRWATHFTAKGHDVTVVSLTPARIAGVNVRIIGPDPERVGRVAYVMCLPRLRKLLRSLKPDLVHAHYAGGYGTTAALAGYHPLVTTAWGTDVLILPRDSRPLRWVIRHSLQRADLVTSMAAHMTETIVNLGVDAGRVITLPFGVDTSVFNPRARKHSGNRAPLIVSTRHLHPLYNVGQLLESLPVVLQAFPSAKAVIIGEGSQRRELQNRAHKLNIESHVTFLGRRRPGEIADYLSDADVFVSTSTSDGNNISLNEAMACGAFPVVTDIPANREWIRNGENGILCGSGDVAGMAAGLMRAIRDPEMRRQAGEANWNIVQERGSWKVAMETMEAHYHALVSGRRGMVGERRAASDATLAEGIQQP